MNYPNGQKMKVGDKLRLWEGCVVSRTERFASPPAPYLSACYGLKAKAAGKYKGRKPLNDALREEVVRLADSGSTKSKIARQLNIGEATVYRILSANKKNGQEIRVRKDPFVNE